MCKVLLVKICVYCDLLDFFDGTYFLLIDIDIDKHRHKTNTQKGEKIKAKSEPKEG
jgi:hypothetical protein